MSQVVRCVDCGDIVMIESGTTIHDLAKHQKCDKCGSDNVRIMDEEYVPFVVDLRSKGILISDISGVHIEFNPNSKKYKRSDRVVIAFAKTIDGYRFKIKDFDSSNVPEANYMYMEMRRLFESINDKSYTETTVWIGSIDYTISPETIRVKYYDDDTVYLQAAITISIGEDKADLDPFDVKIGVIDILQYLTRFADIYIDSDTETVYVKGTSLSSKSIEWVEGVKPKRDRQVYPKN